MRKSLSFVAVATMTLSAFFQASPALAACAGSYPTIGTIQGVTVQGDYSMFVLDHADTYDTSLFSGGAVSIDRYNELATGFKQNNYRVPAKFVRTLSQYETADVVHSNLRASVSNAALAKLSYQPGDIVIVGPPGGASCTQYGFVGFFGSGGTITSAVAYDSGLLGYSYGSELLALSAGSEYGCSTQNSWGTTCQAPITYVVNGSVVTVSPGETKSLAGTKFKQVSLLTSTHTTPPPPQCNADGTSCSSSWIEDFDPRSLLQVIMFQNGATPQGAAFTATPTSGISPLSVNFTASRLDATSYTVDFGDSSSAPMSVIIPPCYPGADCSRANSAQTNHVYRGAGTYTAKLLKNPDAVGDCYGCVQAQPVVLSSVMITVSEMSNPDPIPNSNSCPSLWRSLSLGSRGQDVVRLQNFFIAQGYLAAGNDSGYFGRLTKAAVVQFQYAQGLPASGLVGPLTRAAIQRLCGDANPPIVACTAIGWVPPTSFCETGWQATHNENGCQDGWQCVTASGTCPAPHTGYCNGTWHQTQLGIATNGNSCTLGWVCSPPVNYSTGVGNSGSSNGSVGSGVMTY